MERHNRENGCSKKMATVARHPSSWWVLGATLAWPAALGGQAIALIAPNSAVEIKIVAESPRWLPGQVVRSVPPGPCLGVAVDRGTGFHEIVTDFDSIRTVPVTGQTPVYGRGQVRLAAEGCGRDSVTETDPRPGARVPPALATRISHVEHGLARPQVLRRDPDHFSLSERMAHYRVPGVVITVIDSGRIAWTRAYGVRDVGSGRPVDTATIFQVGSISKPVTALAVLRMAIRGDLNLDTDVNRYLTSWKVPNTPLSQGNPVTLRQLLAHRGGINLPSFGGYSRYDTIPTLAQVLQGVAPASTPAAMVVVTPGTQTRYSGGGYEVVQMVLQDMLGAPFPQIMQRLVFQPASMLSSSFDQAMSPDRSETAATGHDANGEPLPGRWFVYPEMAAAGLWTTATDLAQLVLAVQRSVSGQDTTFLPSRTATEMLRELPGGRGLGFEVGGQGRSAFFAHDGANRGFQASLFGFQQTGQGVVIVTNSANGLSLASEIRRAVAREYDWPVLQPPSRNAVDLSRSERERVIGTYRASAGDPGAMVTIYLRSDTLVVRSTYWTGERTLYATGRDHFFTLEGDWEMEFTLDATANPATSMVFGPVRFDRVEP